MITGLNSYHLENNLESWHPSNTWYIIKITVYYSVNMNNQNRNESGKFAAKSNENRQVRSIRLTDSTWDKLGQLASERGITRADLLEECVISGLPVSSQHHSCEKLHNSLDLKNIEELFLSSLKVGKQSPVYKNAVKVLKDFIPFLEKQINSAK
jgi:hypothetical protein